jgi:hypothetical protein
VKKEIRKEQEHWSYDEVWRLLQFGYSKEEKTGFKAENRTSLKKEVKGYKAHQMPRLPRNAYALGDWLPKNKP